VSLPGLSGQSSIRQWLLDRPAEPGDDSRMGVELIGKCSNAGNEEAMPKKQITSAKIRQPSGHFSQATVVEARGRLGNPD
jgi:hypothetical protein